MKHSENQNQIPQNVAQLHNLTNHFSPIILKNIDFKDSKKTVNIYINLILFYL